MNRSEFQTHLSERTFKEMFITDLGWNNPQGQIHLPEFEIDETVFEIECIAQRNGFQILLCQVDAMPKASMVRKLDSKLRMQAHDYLLVFVEPQGNHQCWICPVKNVEKRDIVRVEYANINQTDFLFDKIKNLEFDVEQAVTIVDVKNRVNDSFRVNSEKITKDFYTGFRRQHKAFATFIEGLESENDRQWYTSVMLNRLMFCYFIQKKGFLNNDYNYLQNKLQETKQQEGENKFYSSFYRTFLLSLFHDGLNSPRHERDWERRFGKIPYLNGGMFDVHQLERDFEIDIADEAFEQLFTFFDTWQWHLDTNITATGKDINPDVLGYIFEQYINDRAAMGAYYTKEDITEYIGKNCVVPFLFDRVAEKCPSDFKPNGYVWQTLQASGDTYLYDAVKHGYSTDWQQQIPENIARGIDTTAPNLLERRADWNTPTTDHFTLPTEIWRETVERLERCDTILGKIANGDIRQINDFITYNLNIRQFAEDILAHTQNHHLVRAFYGALRQVTILDPTCGSGAFLFAALNILEPLYEMCIARMEEFNQQNSELFKNELDEINQKYRSNRQYFIYKNIILHNLYGVDIMVEATEIAKLRLFLKMVAVVEVNRRAENLGLDPLPDIDFNIRCGNTLVGYATEKELEDNLMLSGFFTRAEYEDKVKQKMQIVATAYNTFKQLQMQQQVDMADYKQAKQNLHIRLAQLNEMLNRQMYGVTPRHYSYEQFLATHQPFHWLAEFYDIIQGNGGFDVIIGNPPYLEMRQICYVIPTTYKTHESGAVHAMCIERSLSLIHVKGNCSMIVPLALVCTQRMTEVQRLLEDVRSVWYSNFSWRPAKLFDAVNRALSIFIANYNDNGKKAYSTQYIKWISDNRENLYKLINYTEYNDHRHSFWMPKLSCGLERDILQKVLTQKCLFGRLLVKKSNLPIYYRTTGGLYWKVFTNFSPKFTLNGVSCKSSRETCLYLNNDISSSVIVSLLSSNLFWWWYTITSNLRDLNPSDILLFQIPDAILKNNELQLLGEKYLVSLEMNSTMLTREQKNKGTTQTQSFKIKLSKPIIDEIDKVLAKHYGFTDEELDFIINYDIKYRMGDELNAEE